MASTYENDLRLEEMATGENSGSWGTKTNTNLELIADAFSYGTETIADADTTITIADGAADAARSLALKINSSADLTTTRTITLAPNTTSKVWIIENNTSGGQVLTISAGSGSNITLANGTTKIIATDGIGAGSNVVELTQDLAIADMSVDGILSLADGSNSAPSLTNTGDTNTGLYFPAADEVGITTGGTQRVKVDSTGVDVTGVVTTLAGSASAPAYSFGTDTNNGMFKRGTDQLGFSAGGTEIIAVTSTGMFVDTIGAKTTNATLSLKGAGTGGVVVNDDGADRDFRVESDSNTHMLFVDAGSNHVNIGTSTDRGGLLNVDGTTPGIVVRTTDSAAMELIHADNDAGAGPYLYLNRPSSGPAVDDQLGQIVIQGKNSADQAVDYVRLVTQLISPTDGDEQTRFAINTMTSGTIQNRLEILNGESVFNDPSIDVDFRVESDSNSHALFVDAGEGKVRINSTLATDGVLLVKGAESAHPVITVSGSTSNGFTLLADRYQADESILNLGMGYSGANPTFSRAVKPSTTAESAFISSQDTFAAQPAALEIKNDGFRFYHTTTNATTAVDSAVSLTSFLHISGDGVIANDAGTAAADFRVESDSQSIAFQVDASTGEINTHTYGFNIYNYDDGPNLNVSSGRDYNSLMMGAAANYGSNNSAENKWSWNWRGRGVASTTHYNFLYDEISNEEYFRVQADASQKAVVVNEGSHDHDFRVESDNVSHMLFVDASTDNVGIGTSAPANFSGYVGVTTYGASLGSFLQMTGASCTARFVADSSSNTVQIKSVTAHPIDIFTNNTKRATWFEDATYNGMYIQGDIDASFYNTTTNTGISLQGSSQRQTGNGASIQIACDETEGWANQYWNRHTQTGTRDRRYVQMQSQIGGVVGSIEINTSDNGVNYNTSSDYRLKENIVDLTDGITRVKQLQPRRFNFIADETDTPVDGFIAHEVDTVVPEAVSGEKDAMKTDEDGNNVIASQAMDSSRLVPLLTAALQEAITKIETLEARITALENS